MWIWQWGAFRPQSADVVQNLVRLRRQRSALWAFRPHSADGVQNLVRLRRLRSALWAFRPKSADGVQNLVRLRHRRRALWAFRPQSARRVHVHNHAVRIVPAVRSIIMIMCIPYYVVQELALIAAVLSMVYKAIAAAKYIFTF